MTLIFTENFTPSSRIHILLNAHGAFSGIDHMLGHKTSLNKFKKIKVISSIFSEHNGIKLETDHKRKNEKHTKIWRQNNMF